MTVLVVTAAEIESAKGLAQPGEQTVHFDGVSELREANLTIVAPSSGRRTPNQVGGQSAKALAQFLAEKYGDSKRQLNDLYLVAGEAGLWAQGGEPLAQTIADELVLQGFRHNIRVHAIASPTDHQIGAGQSVALVTNRSGQTTIEAKTYASEYLRGLGAKPESEPLSVADMSVWQAGGNCFGRKIVPLLNQAAYRSFMNLPFNTFRPSATTPRVFEKQGRVLFYLKKLREEIVQQYAKRSQQKKKTAIVGVLDNLADWVNAAANDDELIPMVRQAQDQLKHFGKTFGPLSPYKYEEIIKVLGDLLSQLGYVKPDSTGQLNAPLSTKSDFDTFQERARECQALLLEISTLYTQHLPVRVSANVAKMNRLKRRVKSEVDAAAQMVGIDEVKTTFMTQLSAAKVAVIQKQIDTCLDELALLEQQITPYNDSGSYQTEAREALREVRQLKEKITGFQVREDSGHAVEQLAQQIRDLSLQHDSLMYQIFQARGKELIRQIKVLAPELNLPSAGQPGYVATCLGSIAQVNRAYAQSQAEKPAQAIKKHVDYLERVHRSLDSQAYKDVLGVIAACEARTTGCFGFFYSNSAKKARMLKQAVKDIPYKNREHVLQYSDVRQAISFHRNVFHKGVTASYEKLAQDHRVDLTEVPVRTFHP